jgi:formylglycine-generating enzyme required for sulfatase activity
MAEGKMIAVTKSNSLGMQFAWVPPGQSWLGGGGGKPGTKEFTLKDGLWCGVYPVTQQEWQAVMGNNPSYFRWNNPRCAVETVSYEAVQEFIDKLNKHLSEKDGLVYRLPTAQEWEYICRGGPISQDQSQYDFCFARSKTDLTPNPSNDLSSTQANFNGDYPAGSAANGPFLERTCEVGSYLPNPLGIYDLHGNVSEWTSSLSGVSDGSRLTCGGSWNAKAVQCAATFRFIGVYPDADDNRGFRLLAVPFGKEG